MPKEVTIFSSKEARPYLEKLHFHLSNALRNRLPQYSCNSWFNTVIYDNGGDTINSLLQYARRLKADKGYAVFLFTPDDEINIRGDNYFVSRDNVWLEYGLFSGVLGTANAFTVFPEDPVTKNGKTINWHKPSDFTIQRISYPYNDDANTLDLNFESIATKITNIIAQKNGDTGSQRLQNNSKPVEPIGMITKY